MKKFLSLVLALIMTMSLVTISAGATEYKDLTDKDEIKYEEAVAVLNRIGIITGYDDGSFQPTKELTRGAAAKIIVSLLIGPEAASALPNGTAPYPDVPAGSTFAGVISFCKTRNIISGYGDGTFKPTNSLTGYAFAKMLLGALGYDSQVEGFTGTGWTMNVANIGNYAQLFNRLEFDGAASVNREQACQLALNTLKATMVEYTGGININTASGDTMTVNPTRTFKTSNQEYARHISERRAGGSNTIYGSTVETTHYTVEFGEEHFKDLRMVSERQSADAFGRPSNEWSYKKVTIGTFPVEPDFSYTTQVTHRTESTDAAKVRALGLNGYETEGIVRYTTTGAGITDKTVVYENGVVGTLANNKVADIADLTDNGTLVEVYVSEEDADFIETVVVVKTQLMEIKRIGSEAIALDKKDSDADGDIFYGYNQAPIDVVVNDVEINDACFKTLSEMKAGDLVAVVPVDPDHNTNPPSKYDVAKVYAPETVTGKLSNVKQFTKTGAEETIAITVGDTSYNVALWNKDLHEVNGDKVKITRKDVTLYLDEYGNAMLAKGVGDTSNWMVIGNYSQGLVNGRIVNYANGWDIGGEEMSLNIGNTTASQTAINNFKPGDLVYYTNDVNSNTAEWKLYADHPGAVNEGKLKGVFTVFHGTQAGATSEYKIEASNKRILLEDFNTIAADSTTPGAATATVKDNIKFIYVTVDNSDGEVDSVEFRSGVQATTHDELAASLTNGGHSAQAAVSLEDYKVNGVTQAKDVVTTASGVKAVVIKRESSEASVKNLLYIEKVIKTATLDTEGQPVYVYECYNTEGEKVEVASYRKIAPGNWVKQNDMATPEAAKGIEGVTDDNFKRLTGYGADGLQAETWQRSAAVAGTKLIEVNGTNKYLLTTNGTYGATGRAVNNPDISKNWDRDQFTIGTGNGQNIIDAKGAVILDLRTDPNRRLIDSIDQIKDAIKGKGDFEYKTVPGSTTAVKTNGYDIEATILFNDNTDSNDFRTAYVIIIHDITEKGSSTVDPGPVVPSTYGKVTASAGITVKDGKVVTGSTGETHVAFTLVKPEWAFAGGNNRPDIGKVTSYEIRDAADNSLIQTVTKSMSIGEKNASVDLKGNSDGTEFTGEVIISTNSEFNTNRPQESVLKGKKIDVVITGVEWNYAKVELADSAKNCIVLNNGLYLPVGADKAVKNFDITYRTPSGYTLDADGAYHIDGAALVDGETVELSDTLTSGTTYTFRNKGIYAEGGKPVTVSVTGLTKTPLNADGFYVLADTLTAHIVNNAGQIKAVTGAGNDETTIKVQLDDRSGTEVIGGATASGKYAVAIPSGATETAATTMKVTLGSKGTSGSDYYEVEITVRDEAGAVVSTFKKFMAAGTTETWTGSAVAAGADMDLYKLSGNLVIGEDDIKITGLTAPTVGKTASSYDAVNRVLTLKFSDDIDENTVLPSTITAKPANAQDGCTVVGNPEYVDARTVKVALNNFPAATASTNATATVRVEGVKGVNNVPVTAVDVTVIVASKTNSPVAGTDDVGKIS